MSITAAQLLVKVSADTKAAEEGLKRIGREAGDTAGKSGGLLSSLLGFTGAGLIVQGVSAAFSFLKNTVVDSVQQGMTANQVIAQTVAGLKSTRDASGMTAQGVDNLAQHIMSMSGIQDDATATGENMLLTFTNIGKNVFPQATQAMADMATKMNGGAIPAAAQMQSTAILLGKALNDPAKGLTALSRVGVTFDAQQKAQIKTMMAHNDIAGAQSVILKELNKEFGGAAAAAGQANGGIAILSAQFDDMKQRLGQALIPILVQLLQLIQPLATALEGRFSSALAGIPGLVTQLEGAFQSLHLGALEAAFDRMASAASAVGAQIGQATAPVIAQLGQFITGHLLPAVTQFANFAASTLIPMFGQIASFLVSTLGPALLGLAAFVTDTVLPAVEQLIGWFRANVLPVLETLVQVLVQDVLPVLEGLAKTILQKVIPPIERIVGIILPILIPAFQAIGWVIQNVVGPVLNLLLTLLGWLLNKLADFIQAIRDHLPDAIKAIGDFFSGLGTMLHGTITMFTTAGHDLVQGLINGVTGMLGAAQKAISNLGGGILSTVKGVFGVKSPSTVFADIGVNLSQGLINGVKSVDVSSAINGHLGSALTALSSLANPTMVTQLAVTPGAQAAAAAQSAVTQAMLGAGGASAGGQAVILTLDGRAVARGLLPYQAGAIRMATGIRVQ